MRIKVINPNTTQSMTDKIGECARAAARPGTQIIAVSPAMGPVSIESHYDEALAVPGLLQEVATGELEAVDGYIVACFGDRLVSTPRTSVLPGISLQVVAELAGRLGLKFEEQPLTPAELAKADEVMLGSTPNCLLPITRLNRHPIGNGHPGPTYQRLLATWNEFVGLDIAAQAQRFSSR